MTEIKIWYSVVTDGKLPPFIHGEQQKRAALFFDYNSSVSWAIETFLYQWKQERILYSLLTS